MLAAFLLFFFSVFQTNQKHSLDICCGSTVRKFGLCDEIVKRIFKHESGAENRNGESNRKRVLVNKLTNNKLLVSTDVVSKIAAEDLIKTHAVDLCCVFWRN